MGVWTSLAERIRSCHVGAVQQLDKAGPSVVKYARNSAIRGGLLSITARCLALVVYVCVAATGYAVTVRRIEIVSAQSDPGGRSIETERLCPVATSPTVIQLKVGHVHEVAVSGPGSSFRWKVRDPRVATVYVPDEAGRSALVTGIGTGETVLVVESTHNGQPHTDSLTIRGVSRRYTVVAWIDRSRIDAEKSALAPSANAALREALSTWHGCSSEIMRWALGGNGLVGDSEADRLYAKAFLIHGTANDPPPSQLSEKFFVQKTNYKLWNEFQVDWHNVRIRPRSEVGRTGLPCGVSVGSTDGESHTENGKVAWNPARTAQSLINEARIGKIAQWIERAIDPQSLGTPWIWSVIGFDKSGKPGVDMQLFPTYSVYRDGVLCGKRTQGELAQFVSSYKTSELKRRDLDRYGQQDWREPCTE